MSEEDTQGQAGRTPRFPAHLTLFNRPTQRTKADAQNVETEGHNFPQRKDAGGVGVCHPPKQNYGEHHEGDTPGDVESTMLFVVPKGLYAKKS